MTMLPRELLAQAFGNPRLVQAFEEQARTVDQTQAATASAAQTTERLEQATVLTLSPNAALVNERVLFAGFGIEAADDGQRLTLRLSDGAAQIQGGHPVRFTAFGPTMLGLPLSGFLATRDGAEALANKTLLAPKLSGLVDAADDAAAGAANVPVGGVYRTGSALKVRTA